MRVEGGVELREMIQDGAKQLAARHPEDYQTGSTAWVTARFSAHNPLPERRWRKWLEESY